MNGEVLFTKTHEWVQFLNKTTARIGLTDFAQKELGDIVYINLPEAGEEVFVKEVFADVESVKAVSNVYSPVTGKIKAVNEELLDKPELVNESSYDAWFIEVEDIREQVELLLEEEYLRQCKEE